MKPCIGLDESTEEIGLFLSGCQNSTGFVVAAKFKSRSSQIVGFPSGGFGYD